MKKNNNQTVVALGFFDGVHNGHKSLINLAVTIAKKYYCRSAVMTFKEHPLRLIFPAYAPPMITTNDEKISIIKSMGIDDIYVNRFDEALMNLSPEDFVHDYLLAKYQVKHIVVGFNYTFGYKGEGKTDTLLSLGEKYGFGVSVMPPTIICGQTVSSTMIRDLIASGKVSEVEGFLGRKYKIKGHIVVGKRLGHTFDIPTANLKLSDKVILPGAGVYYTRVHVRGKYFDGITNLGHNPTFEKHPYTIETYIYDFSDDIYGELLEITFLERIRNEVKFDSMKELIAQIRNDIVFVDEHYRKRK